MPQGIRQEDRLTCSRRIRAVRGFLARLLQVDEFDD
jgi:hypothetical protein